MQKRYLIFIIGILMISIVSASMLIPSSDKAKENARAPEKSPVITETEAGEWELDRVDFIHYAKPENPGKPPKNPKSETCYELMGVKWKSLPVGYIINPLNMLNPNSTNYLSLDFITTAISTSAETWDDATSSELFDNQYSINYYEQYGVQNFNNVIAFGDYPQEGVIGVTTIWFTRRGKKIVEFDMLLDTDFTWGDATIDPTVMDLQNIATHEFGHAVGMDDIYSDSCNEVTMYGYSTEGDTIKRTLEQPDITGLQEMYGV